MKSVHVILLLFIFNLSTSNAQSQWGIKLNSESAFDGYMLFETDDDTYLINNCGEILNKWTGISQTDNHTKFLENGNMLYIFDNSVFEVDWDGNIINQVTHGQDDLLLEYEIELLPDGNYLCVSRRDMSQLDFQNLGYDVPNTFPTRIDGVVELDRNTGQVVWEWNIRDHVIQERDPSAPNYGLIAQNPGLLNMDAISTYDWQTTESFMINSMDYNAERDEIIVSVRKMCEVVIIDHSTTAAEAMGHSGGRHGKGGDVIYRWGNPANYGAGVPANYDFGQEAENDQRLYYQHNPHWIDHGEHKGKIMIYSNGLNRPAQTFDSRYSNIPVISPEYDADDLYVLTPGQAYGPEEPDVEFKGNNPLGVFYSGYTSGASFLPNGNLYITEGSKGRISEITPEGERVFEYEIFDHDYIFRSEKYAKDHPAFEGRDLDNIATLGTVENPSSDYQCELFTSVENQALPTSLEVDLFHHPGYHPEGKLLNYKYKELNVHLINIYGQTVLSFATGQYETPIDLSAMPAGTYVLIVNDREGKTSKSFKVITI